jgi:hypothetical protein
MESQDIDWTKVLTVAGLIFAVALGVGILLLTWVILRVRRINLPPDADWITALRATPLIVVVVLDVLDFSLDFLAAPIGWLLLTRLGLGPLRAITVVEALVPFTRLIPLMTTAWILVRVLKLHGTALSQR